MVTPAREHTAQAALLIGCADDHSFFVALQAWSVGC